jgi:hypothetical protein
MIFAVAAVAVLAYGIYQSQIESNDEPTIAPPTSEPGGNKLINITNALEDQGLKVEIVRSSFRSPQLSVPGQGLSVDNGKLYVFIYPGRTAVEDREAESKDLDPSTLTVLTVSGTPVAGNAPHVVSNSNVIAVLPSASQDVIDKVDAAIQGLP